MADAYFKKVSEPASQEIAEEVMASSSSDSGEESDSSSTSSSSTSCSSSSSSLSRSHRKKRVPGPSRRARRARSGNHFVDRLPQAVRNRVQALRNIQDECDKVDALFLRAIHDLERKYAELNKPLYDRRFQIINAEYEPTEEECEWNSEDEVFSSDEEVEDDTPGEMPALEGEEEDEDPKEKPEVKAEEKEVHKEIPEAKAEEKADSKDFLEAKPTVKADPREVPQAKAEEKEQPKATEAKARTAVKEVPKRVPETRPKERINLKRARKGKPKKEDPKGIPDYWLTVLKNVDKLGPMIQKYDEPILKFLSDVSLKFSKPGQPISYQFEFHFLPNPYFRNEVLTKTYIIKSKPDHNDPFFSWGWEIEDCKGCKIYWRRGKDVTVTTTHSRTTATGETEIQPRVVPNASFFNFFSPPEIPKIGKLEPREDAILDEDFAIGQILHDNVILKSIYYYTGEASGTYEDGKDYGNRKYRK
ncbi:nucleosome assembly protein 1-like 3 [Trichechus manatus latirostris]|uniref:Nucleosome assembly protein 1-like 3 n=1 Tax=Trichechus manatus latirostris TaxID=127582 RepID=A0A2Y9DMV5_TRIMA|nr:nucleosome assembly protein 1-like 3 [Trichechus manatus latirostris]